MSSTDVKAAIHLSDIDAVAASRCSVFQEPKEFLETSLNIVFILKEPIAFSISYHAQLRPELNSYTLYILQYISSQLDTSFVLPLLDSSHPLLLFFACCFRVV